MVFLERETWLLGRPITTNVWSYVPKFVHLDHQKLLCSLRFLFFYISHIKMDLPNVNHSPKEFRCRLLPLDWVMMMNVIRQRHTIAICTTLRWFDYWMQFGALTDSQSIHGDLRCIENASFYSEIITRQSNNGKHFSFSYSIHASASTHSTIFCLAEPSWQVKIIQLCVFSLPFWYYLLWLLSLLRGIICSLADLMHRSLM